MLALTPGLVAAQAGLPPLTWPDAPAARAALATSPWAGRLLASRTVAPNSAVLAATLATAPLEGAPAPALLLTLPTPDGGLARFRVVEAPVMAPALAAQFPQIKTYAGIGLDDPTATLRADLTPEGFHAQVLSRREGGTFYLDPVENTVPARGLVVYARQSLLPAAGSRMSCQTVGSAPTGSGSGTPGGTSPSGPAPQQRVQTSLGGTLRTYRLAVAATGEYTAFHGGTVAQAQAAIVTTVNRVTGVYEKELAVRMVLVANNSSLVYTNASTDPYANSSNDLNANQTNINSVIGSANYDIGHLVGTGGGGVAQLGSVCGSGKARGLTGSGSPVNDAFDIDYVAHEIGHQFGGNHPFNGSTGSCTGANRNASTAWEPGSGSTIQGYAGICSPQDLQSNSDAYFHGGNISEMTTFITSTSCAATAATGNTPPVVTTPANKSIPASTPFRLTGAATDAEGDALTYCWEEMDLGAQGAPVTPTTTQTANSTVPLFRSWLPTASPVRYFPRLNELRNNTVAYGEALPTVARTLTFRCTVRDQHFSSSQNRIVGGVNQSGTVTLTTVNTGAAFAVTAPNTALTWTGGTTQTVTWNVAGTTANGINCASVNILLSTDGGLTFPTTLASGVSNSGTATVTVPNTPSTTARVMVAAADNYFFDISNANFTIVNGSANSPTITSFAPVSGAVGTSVTITGTNLTGATTVRFNGTSATFTVNSATSITATVPAGATTGPLAVTTANGTGTSGTSFTVLTAPTVTSFSPTSGAAGTTVTVTGSGFTGTTLVRFNGTSASFTVVSATSLTATVPVGATTGPLSVTNPQGTGTSTTSFTVVAAPANDLCSAVNLPVLTCGNAQTGTTVNATATGDPTGTCTTTIDGGGVFYRFTGPGGSVTISTCGTTTTYDSKLFVFTGSCGALTCVGGNDDVTCGSQTRTSTVTFTSVAGTNYYVFVGGYSTNTGPFTIKATCGTTPPTITSFSPTSGAPGVSVTITGTNLSTTQNVAFNGTPAASISGATATSVTATVPAGASTGPLTVTTSTGSVVSATNFTVLNPPVIAAQTFSVPENSAVGTVVGTVVAADPDAGQTLTYTITGGNPGGAFSLTGNQLTVNTAGLDFEATPTYALTVQVTDNDSPASSSSATVTVNLTNVNEAPAVAAQSFSVAENSAAGTVVGTVAAADPDAGTTLTYAITAGNAGGVFGFTDNQLTVNTAALDFETTPTYTLTVQVSDGALTASATVTVSVTDVTEAPTINSFSPATGPVGTSVTLTGTNFTGATAVTFNGTSAAFTVASATSISSTVPAGATTGPLSVTTPDGSATSTTSFTVTVAAPAPMITSFSPAAGTYEGQSVTITGTNLGGATVRFNGTVATVTANTATSISTTVPAGATTGALTVTTAGGTATAPATFNVTPIINAYTPNRGPAGTTVTLTGSGFAGATVVKIGTLNAASFTVVSNTQITAVVAAGAATGKITVTTPSGTRVTNGSFTVTASTTPTPALSSFTPTTAPVGTSVTISGSGFTGATAVSFNGTSAAFTVASATSITTTVPTGATTGLLSVTTPGGTATSATSFTVTMTGSPAGAPTITSFSPAAGTYQGQPVTITGTNLSGATVSFNGTVATVTANTATSISTTVPAGATTGALTVTTAGGTATAPTTFNVTPIINAYSPTRGPAGTIVTLTGSGFTGATVVKIGTLNAASFTVVSNTQITAVVAAGAATGKITVTTPSGTRVTNGSFTVTAGRPAGPLARSADAPVADVRVALFPNPAHEAVRVQLTPQPTATPVTVRDVTGRLLSTTILRAGEAETTVDLTSYPAGVYWVQVAGRTHRLLVE